MNVLVRNVNSGKYLKARGVWTDNIEEARDFKTTHQAILSRDWQDNEVVEVVLSFGEKQYEIRIVINPEQRRDDIRHPFK
jgi:hypothetical protein